MTSIICLSEGYLSYPQPFKVFWQIGLDIKNIDGQSSRLKRFIVRVTSRIPTETDTINFLQVAQGLV